MNKLRKLLFVVSLVVAISFVIPNQLVFASDGIVETNFFGNIEDDNEGCGVFMIINSVVDILSMGVAILGVIGVVIVGTTYLTAGGNEDKTRKAKHRMFEIVIGLAVYAILYAGVQWLLPGGKVNSSCKTLTDEQVAKIREEEEKKNSPEKTNNKPTSSSSSSSSSPSSSGVNDGKLTGKTEYEKKINSKPFQLKVTGADKIKYKSSDKRVAWVTKEGVVYPNDIGTAYVTASANGQKVKIKIKIKKRTKHVEVGEAAGGTGSSSVRVSDWYKNSSYGDWNYVFRFVNPVKAEIAADAMIATANNNHIEYDQSETKEGLMSFTYALRKADWNPKKIKKDVYTACSQAVLTMVQAAGYHRKTKDWPWAHASKAAEKLRNSSHFYTITKNSYTKNWERLKRGDILIDSVPEGCNTNCNRHAVMVVE